MTRKSGFSVHKETTGGEFSRQNVAAHALAKGEEIEVSFYIDGHQPGDFLGFGMWFWHSDGIESELIGSPFIPTWTGYSSLSWNKVGSIWEASTSTPVSVVFKLIAVEAGKASFYQPLCGRLKHKHYEDAPHRLMKNMFETAPEAIFVDDEVNASVNISFPDGSETEHAEIILKSCNRCGRYLPINIINERNHLSFTNHCVAAHRRPCQHSSFGKLRNVENQSEILHLDYGYQLECRFCKKFEVNAAHNPQRSPGQMKEDGARRRAFELLLETLFEGSPQLIYRHKFSSELAEDIWEKFQRRCFNCNTYLPNARAMHLDHTRPLAYLWPLDETATALCKSCNSQKRDRMPTDFYVKHGQLEALAQKTGISLEELKNPKPNETAIDLLLARKHWFFSTFLTRPEMCKEREGKIAGELVVKALQRVLASSEKHQFVNLQDEYAQLRDK
ncbi:hypothetical protein TH5_24465 [Thalassospira xianhensis MCCC 1A02616]|uniref:HNH nuclease domain-containing protein n=2 Tax=Thalassospira xianhensis TaxID=478503 RepID=A0A367U9A5_9PROT|nr:hypothetical protein TH5_24465 [Thalassospira xianhensis MCCC 1A02616]